MAYKILLPFDGSQCSVKAAEHVAELMSWGRDIHCTVLFVMPFTRDLAGYLGMLEDEYTYKAGEVAGRINSQASSIFENRGLQINTVILEGDPVEVICHMAKQDEYQEIIMGSRGHNGIKKLIKGNFSEKVVRMAPCPVKVIKQ